MSTVVVGGGIAGVAAAYFLSECGEDVTLVERESLGSGVTRNSFGGVRQQFSTPLEIALARRGLAFWKTARERLGHPCHFHEDGYLFATGDEQRISELRSSAALQETYADGPCVMLSPDEVGEHFPWIDPDGLLGACWTPEDGHVDHMDGVSGLAAACRRNGGSILLGWHVTEVRASATGVVVTARDGRELAADRAVIAAGIWSGPLAAGLGLDLNIDSWPLHSILTDTALAGEPVPLFIDLDSGLIVEREGDGLVIAVLVSHPDDTYGPDEMMARFNDEARIRTPSLLDVGVRKVLSAKVDGSIDGHPCAGLVNDRVAIVAGFAGRGVMHGPPVAEWVAAAVLGLDRSGRGDMAELEGLGIAQTYDPWREPDLSGEESLVADRMGRDWQV